MENVPPSHIFLWSYRILTHEVPKDQKSSPPQRLQMQRATFDVTDAKGRRCHLRPFAEVPRFTLRPRSARRRQIGDGRASGDRRAGDGSCGRSSRGGFGDGFVTARQVLEAFSATRLGRA